MDIIIFVYILSIFFGDNLKQIRYETFSKKTSKTLITIISPPFQSTYLESVSGRRGGCEGGAVETGPHVRGESLRQPQVDSLEGVCGFLCRRKLI